MPVDYDPKDATKCWPEGPYDAVLKTVEDKTSKMKPDGSGGNPMQVWTWEIYHPNGQTQLISDYVVIPGATFKIKQLARALGKEDQFKAGKFQADDNLGCCVTAELTVEQQSGYDDKNKIGKLVAKDKPGSGQQYPRDANSIRRERQAVPASLPDSGGVPIDDIPF